MQTKLEIGDRWANGHGKYETFIIDANLERTRIQEAYRRGTEILGIEVRHTYAGKEQINYKGIDSFCDKYGESAIPEYFVDLLGMHGILDGVEDCGELTEYTHTDQFLAIYLGIVKLGEPSFTYKIVSDNIQTMDIGGYGLFH